MSVQDHASIGTPLLEARNIDTYYGAVKAVSGVSLSVPKGSIVTVLGANGAGKTTILRTISGILVPQDGEIQFKGGRIDAMAPDRIVRQGLCQSPEGREIFPFLSVHDNLMLGAFTRNDRDAVARDLEMCFDYFPRLKDREKQRAGQMSGGEQQMLAIARALMGRPELLLLDEPSLGLSPLLSIQIFDIVRRVNRERGVSVLVVEQNAHLALQTADYGYVLEVGRIVKEGPCRELLKSADIQEFYLGNKASGERGQRRWRRKRQWD